MRFMQEFIVESENFPDLFYNFQIAQKIFSVNCLRFSKQLWASQL